MQQPPLKVPGLTLRLDQYLFPIRRESPEGKGRESVTEATMLPSGGPSGVRDIVQPTEVGDAIKHLNNDATDPITRQSAIDFNARLHPVEGASVLSVDVLVGMGGLTQRCSILSRQKKRLSVSIHGEGRKEIVELFNGKKEMDKAIGNGGFMDRMKNYFNKGA